MKRRHDVVAMDRESVEEVAEYAGAAHLAHRNRHDKSRRASRRFRGGSTVVDDQSPSVEPSEAAVA